MEGERDILWFFDLTLIVKAINGAFEIVGAVLVLVVPPAFVVRVIEFVTAGELAQDPDDFIATTLRNVAHSFAVRPHLLIALYLAVHGIVKLSLVIGIFAKKHMAYPLFMMALLVFGGYELYRGFVRYDWFLYSLAIFDFAIVLLTAHEYRRAYPILVLAKA